MSKVNDLKQENIQKVLQYFYEKDSIWTKNELSNLTGISLAGTTNILMELQESNIIHYIGDANSTGGRKSKNYKINLDYKHIATLNLKKESIGYFYSFKLYNLDYSVIREEFIQNNIEDYDNLIQLLELVKNEKIDQMIVSIPGVSIQGVVDLCDIHYLENLNLIQTIQEIIDCDVIIENDVNIACIGFSRKYPDQKDLAFVYQPSQDYVGCGMILNGKLYNGFSHFAGELRYLPYYTHEKQDKQLKKDPQKLLMRQIATLCTVINPSYIGYHSDRFKQFSLSLDDYIPFKHQPTLVYEEDINELIEKGLLLIGINNLKKERDYE